MAIFDRFKRKQRVVLPEEVNEYYQSQRRERVSVAVILGVVALVVTLLIAAGLFFGGRFVYRQIADKDDKKPTATVQKDNKSTEGNKKATNGEVNAPTNPSSSTSTGSSSTTNTSPSTSTSTTRTQSTTPTTSSSTQTPATGDATTLPHTGDEGM